MNLLLLINGNSKKIIAAHNFKESDFNIIKIDEKKLASPSYIKSLIKSSNYQKVYFGTTIIDLQRFHFFMKAYLFLSGNQKGAIIDEKGNSNNYSLAKLFFYESPKLLFEALASFVVVTYFYIKLPILKWNLLKKN